MKSKLFSAFISFLIVVVLYSCSDHIVPGFTYYPEIPVCGQKVTFTNTTTGDADWEAEYWNWNFGDGYKSVAENPTHKFKEAGEYTVTLMVDSSKHSTCSELITVYDSIPTIYAEDTVEYYQKVNIKPLIYNPYSEDITYDWTYSENAFSDSIVKKDTIVDGKAIVVGKSTSTKMTVYFSKHDVNEVIKLRVTVGDSVYNVQDTFYVHDYKAKSLLMTQKNGNILRQRIYDLGTESATLTNLSSGENGLCFTSYGNYAYLFNVGSSLSPSATGSGDGSIKAIDLTTDQMTTVVSNTSSSAAYSFYTGSVDKNYIYWTDYQNYVYRIPSDTRNLSFEWDGDAQTQKSYYFVRPNRLGYFGNGLSNNQLNGGFATFDNAYFWAKGGTGKGIYCFGSSDILTSDVSGTGTFPSLGAILTSYSIRAFTIDQINQKIYFSVTAPSDKVGFWVSNIDGTNVQLIDDAPMDDPMLYISGIVVDNASNRVYWAYRSPSGLSESYYTEHPTHRTGVKMAQLATTYKSAGAIEYFALGVEVYGLALDEVKK